MLIEIFSDLVCPWCYIGKLRLDRALAERPHLAVDLKWVPFQLNPDMPMGGMDRRTYLASKFGGAERARQVYAVIAQTAEREGVRVAFDRIRRTPSTLDAHRLVAYADRAGCATPMTMVLFDAFFVRGLDIGDRSVLAMLAEEVGLDRDAAASYLAGPADVMRVRASDGQARAAGIQAVPYFIFNRRYAIAGAQDADTFHPLLDLITDDAPVSAG